MKFAKHPITELIVFYVLIIFSTVSCDNDINRIRDHNKDCKINIGFLSAQTGGASHFGLPAYYTYQYAVNDLNEYYGRDIFFNSVIVDTKSDKDNCLQELMSFKQQGINLVIGPFTSSELSNIREFAKENSMVVISPSSVARNIAFSDDYIFRMASDDSYQTEAMLKLLDRDNIKNIILIWRDDVWGNDLSGLVKSGFNDIGGIVFDSLKYDPSTTDYTSVIGELAAKTTQMLNNYTASECAIYLLSFNEAESILEKASGSSSQLGDIKWYGSSAVSQSSPFLANPTASAFAVQVGFLCPIHGLDDNAEDKYTAINSYVESQSGLSANIYSYNTYDALWLAVATSLISDINNPREFADAFRKTGSNYFGATGRVLFNDAGDRIPETFDFFGVENVSGEYKWIRQEVYDFGTGTFH
ncbi:ABC transporter substrate-binding protein [bacterium BMS3Abin03]|nr:ABC transporter substrate-binding protein [bacterium BMS3Abin03]